MKVYFLLAISVVLPVAAQLLMKKGMNAVGAFNFQLDFAFLSRTFTNFYVLAGISVYVLATFIWLIVISKLDISTAYPAISLSYIILIIASYFFFHEPLTIHKILGSIFIVSGVFILFTK